MTLIRSSASLGLIKWKDYVTKAVDLFKKHQQQEPKQLSSSFSSSYDNKKQQSQVISTKPSPKSTDIDIEWLD